MAPVLAAILLQAAAPAPAVSAQTLALGRRLAAAGGLVGMVPLLIEKDLAELANEDPGLTPAQRERLLAIGRTRGAAARSRLVDRIGQGYARSLTAAELATLVAQAESPAAARLRAVQPGVVAEAVAALGPLDLKKDAAALFCRETGRLCARR